MNTLNEQEWEKLQQANVLATVQHAFDMSDTEATDDDDLMTSVDMLSPTAPTDAQTLALMLQEQLDAINNEIRSVVDRNNKIRSVGNGDYNVEGCVMTSEFCG